MPREDPTDAHASLTLPGALDTGPAPPVSAAVGLVCAVRCVGRARVGLGARWVRVQRQRAGGGVLPARSGPAAVTLNAPADEIAERGGRFDGHID